MYKILLPGIVFVLKKKFFRPSKKIFFILKKFISDLQIFCTKKICFRLSKKFFVLKKNFFLDLQKIFSGTKKKFFLDLQKKNFILDLQKNFFWIKKFLHSKKISLQHEKFFLEHISNEQLSKVNNFYKRSCCLQQLLFYRLVLFFVKFIICT